MVLKLFGSAKSTCTRRAATVLHEKQVPFEFHQVELAKGEHKSPEYLEKQPFGQVPYIVSAPQFMIPSDALEIGVTIRFGLG